MASVLITGGAGYIGAVLTEHLLQQGHQVIVLDNLMYHQKSLLHLTHYPQFTFVLGDVRDKKIITKLLSSAEYIIPLAAIVGAPACEKKQEDAQSINFESIKLLSSLLAPSQKVIYPTTNSGYGTKSSQMFCTEETPLEPISVYGITKVKAEELLLQQGQAITLRLATVFGTSPRMRTDLLVNNLVQRAFFDKKITLFEAHFKRNFIHIRDVARCFEHCIQNFNRMKGQAYNVGLDDANLSKKELAVKIRQHLPQISIIHENITKDPDKRNYMVSNKKLYATGFTPQFSLDLGIVELIKTYQIMGDVSSTNV